MRGFTKNLRHTHMVGDDTPERIVAASECAALQATNVYVTGLTDAGRGYQMVRVRPTFEQLSVCVGGEGWVLIDDQWRPCRAGQAFFNPLYADHAYQTCGRRRWQFCWVIFTEPRPGELPMVDTQGSHFIDADPRGLWGSIEGLHRESAGVAEPVMMERWVALVQAHAARILDPHHARDPLWRLWAAVTSDLAAHWSLDRLAEHAMVSAEHLRRLCLKSTGRTPVEHVTHLRIARAAALLESTPMKIAAVAGAVGYANSFAFSTAFRRAKGISPIAWRARGRSLPKRGAVQHD